MVGFPNNSCHHQIDLVYRSERLIAGLSRLVGGQACCRTVHVARIAGVMSRLLHSVELGKREARTVGPSLLDNE